MHQTGVYVPDWSNENEDNRSSENGDHGFEGIFSANRLLQGVRELHRNGPTFSHFAFVHDICMASIAILAAFFLVPGLGAASGQWGVITRDILAFTLIAAVAFLVFRPYWSLWRYTSLPDLISIMNVATIVSLTYLVADRIVGPFSIAEWGTYLNAWLLMVALLSGPRVLARISAVPRLDRTGRSDDSKIPLLLVGAGDGTELFIRALQKDPAARFRIVGIVDEMGANFRRSIHGIEVLGALRDLPTVVRNLDRRGDRPQRLVITEEQLSPTSLKSMLDEA